MIPLFSSEQIRLADKYAIDDLGIPGVVLMENASINIKNAILEVFPELTYNDKIGIICGRGNNGGDGYAVARHLINEGFSVKVLSLAPEKDLSSDAHVNQRILKKLVHEQKTSSLIGYKSVKDLKIISDCSVIIDAMLGTGAKGELREPYSTIVEKINEFDVLRIAIDIPTGLDVDTGFGNRVFNADMTITLADFKRGLFYGDGYTHSGIIKKGAIGIGSEYFNDLDTSEFLIEPEDAYYGLPSRNIGSHKYSAGKVLSIAGSGQYPGAACLCANSVLNVGAGASILAFPKSIKEVVQTKFESAVVEAYDDENLEYLQKKNVLDFEEYLNWSNVIALGPGLGRDPETINAVLEILDLAKNKPFVIDADAIYALGKNEFKNINLANKILTPHHKEFSDLLGISTNALERDLLSYGKSFTSETGAYLVLKGAPTIIFSPSGEAFINSVGNSGMSKFGVGDVLTGTIAGLLAQSNNIEETLISAVYIHSLAADLLLSEYGEYGITAELISKNLGKAITFLRKTFE